MMQTVVTDQSSGNYNKSMDLMDSMNMKNMKVKSNNCNLSDFASSYAGALKLRSKIPTEKLSKKCSQCGYASSYTSALKTRVAQSAEAQKQRCTKIFVLDENLDPRHTLFCREISFVANYAL